MPSTILVHAQALSYLCRGQPCATIAGDDCMELRYCISSNPFIALAALGHAAWLNLVYKLGSGRLVQTASAHMNKLRYKLRFMTAKKEFASSVDAVQMSESRAALLLQQD